MLCAYLFGYLFCSPNSACTKGVLTWALENSAPTAPIPGVNAGTLSWGLMEFAPNSAPSPPIPVLKAGTLSWGPMDFASNGGNSGGYGRDPMVGPYGWGPIVGPYCGALMVGSYCNNNSNASKWLQQLQQLQQLQYY